MFFSHLVDCSNFFKLDVFPTGLLYSWLYIQHKFMRIQKEFLNHHSQKNKAKQRGLFYEISLLSLFQSAWQAGRNTLAAQCKILFFYKMKRRTSYVRRIQLSQTYKSTYNQYENSDTNRLVYEIEDKICLMCIIMYYLLSM